jgi:hypothetical protein
VSSQITKNQQEALTGKKRQRRSRKKNQTQVSETKSTKSKLRARMQPVSNFIKEYGPLAAKPSGKATGLSGKNTAGK